VLPEGAVPVARTSVRLSAKGAGAREPGPEEDHRRASIGYPDAQRCEGKKILSLFANWELLEQYIHGQRWQACEVLKLHRSTYRYPHRGGAVDAAHRGPLAVRARRLRELLEELRSDTLESSLEA
jgi:hypothetical protein